MIVANTSCGATHVFELRDQEALGGLLALIRADQITALSILHDGAQHVLCLPRRFRSRPVFGVELVTDRAGVGVAERAYTQAGDVRISITRSFASKLVRTSAERTGRQLYNPLLQGRK